MNVFQSLRSPLCALTALLTLGMGSEVSAESVTTTPMGAVTVDLAQGYTMVGLPMVEATVLAGVASGNTDSTISFSDIVNVGAALSADGLYYAEISSGPLEGERFDVDTAATKALGGNRLVLNVGSLNNTFSLSLNQIEAGKVLVRKHITLVRVASFITPALVGSNSVVSADQILMYDAQVGSFRTYYLRADNVTWRRSGSADSVGSAVVIPPGTGFFVKKSTSAAKLTQVGVIRTNDFSMPIASGLQLFSYPFPSPVSPRGLGGALANGWFGSNSVGSADQIILYNAGVGSYNTYFLRLDGVTWRKSGVADDVRDIQVVKPGAGFWIKKETPDANYILNLPYTL